ncbi:type IV pilus twitching motility protein PilT [Aciditerrimonas ferrireducens]|uniref:Type IV pilus twitching motility protein PilT n=1 Tax=Aciditerrimonas ferrireducens TaxID=667306 RepID=A0ABV6C5R4_9ACTN|nr:PilT/PilU family type 4a pilus ATPase [Aciditerrimonas ferrireducens]
MGHPDLDRLLAMLAALDGSDLHLKAGAPPRVRVDGALRTLEGEPSLSAEQTEAMAEAILPPELREEFRRRHEADFAYSVPGLGRFRTNAYRQRGSVALAMRRVRSVASGLRELGLPEVVRRLAEERRGLVLVTGPTGSGKSTTLAAMVDHINHTWPCHVVTIEDPVEYLHRDDLASIDQREVGFDTESFASAMRVVLRQDPDVILVGEMRDQETVYTALTAAETGHLVLSTLHTTTATETVNRVVDLFPPHQQGQIRTTLASCLKGVVCQRLLPRADGRGRVPAVEVLVVNGRIQQAIEEPELTSTIDQIMAEGDWYGMQTFDQALVELLAQGVIDLKVAMGAASNPHDLKVMLERRGLVRTGVTSSSAAVPAVG